MKGWWNNEQGWAGSKGSQACWASEPTRSEAGVWASLLWKPLSKEGLDELMIAGMWLFPASIRTPRLWCPSKLQMHPQLMQELFRTNPTDGLIPMQNDDIQKYSPEQCENRGKREATNCPCAQVVQYNLQPCWGIPEDKIMIWYKILSRMCC